MLHGVLVVLASAAIVSAAGELLCSEQSFASLGGAFPSPKSPHEYTTCADGVVQTVPCPTGHQFDAYTRSCTDRPVLAKSRTQVAFQFEELCTDPNVVQIFPNPTNCSQYVICFGLVPIEQNCTDGLLFNPELQTCDIPTNVVCGYSCPAVDDPYNPVWLPDARLQDCARHYLCFQGEPLQFFCYNNLYFDIVSRTCTYPQYADCRVPGVYCNTTSTVNVENPRSCTSYYTCVNGFPQYRECLDDHYFSVEQSVCVPGACLPSTTTLEPTSSSTVDLTSVTVSNGTTPTFTDPPTTTLDPGTTGFTTTTEGSSLSTDISSTSIGITMPVSTSTAESPTTETTFFPPTTDFTPTVTESSSISTSTEGTTSTDSTPEPGTTTTVETISTTSPITTAEPQTTTETTSSAVTDSSTVELSTEESTSTTTQEVSTSTTDVATTPESSPTTTTEIPTETTTDGPPSTTEESTTTTEPATTTLEATTTTETTATTDSTTTELPSTTTTEMVTVDPNVLCAGLGIQILPYPGNCYMYILCIEGIGAVATCPADQIFNPVSRTCAPGNQETCTLT